MRAAATVSLLVLFVAPAFCQTGGSDPVVARFLEYRAAVEKKDFVAADAAATAALAASEAVNGSRTAVLAFNLATLRLALADPARAL